MNCSFFLAFALLFSSDPMAGGLSSYEGGVKAGQVGHWAEARASFLAARSFKKEDSERPLYSPNFLAAYSEYRIALDDKDQGDQIKEFHTARAEFDLLLKEGKCSRETLFYLDLIDTRLHDPDHHAKMLKEVVDKGPRRYWKEDQRCLAPEEMSAMQLLPDRPGFASVEKIDGKGTAQTILAGNLISGQGRDSGVSGLGEVPTLPDKFALVIGQDTDQAGALPCASYDAKIIRDALVGSAGYDANHVVLLQNSSASAVMEQAKALAAQVAQDGVVLIFYAGSGSSVQGKDYLACSDTSSSLDPETMISKSVLYHMFLQKGARIFSFYEVNRPIENGFFFGSEVPRSGSVSQMEATVPDATVTTTVSKGHQIGLYANAFSQVLGEIRSNQVPIVEFGWQIYTKMRRGGSGGEGGSSSQTPTLPVLNNLASDARF